MENLIEDLLKETYSEFYKLPLQSWKRSSGNGSTQMKVENMPATVIAFCDELCSRIIKQKREKEGIMG